MARQVKKLAKKQDVEGLVALLRQQEDERESVAAADALGKLSDGEAIKPLIAAAKDKRDGVRSAAVEALGRLGSSLGTTVAIRSLASRLEDENWRVRVQAANALGVTRGSKTFEPLVLALNDEEQKVRLVAIEGLQALASPKAIDPLILHSQRITDQKELEQIALALHGCGYYMGRGAIRHR